MKQISVTKTHNLQEAPELCIGALLLRSLGPAVTTVMAPVICHHMWRVGWREEVVCLLWVGWCDPRLFHITPGSRVCVHPLGGRNKSRRGVFSQLAASNQGWATNESALGQADPLAAGQARFPLCFVAGFYKSLLHFQCSPEELIRETTMFLLLVALNDPQNANKESYSCLKYSCCYVIKYKGTNIRAGSLIKRRFVCRMWLQHQCCLNSALAWFYLCPWGWACAWMFHTSVLSESNRMQNPCDVKVLR